MDQRDREIEGVGVGGDLEGSGGEESLKLVPVSESIRYRKRAQAAEQAKSELSEQLRGEQFERGRLEKRLAEVEVERELSMKLLAGGVSDLEAGLLLGKKRLAEVEGEGDVGGVVSELIKEKPYLFESGAGIGGGAVAGRRTSGTREKLGGVKSALSRVAGKAVNSGSREDVQEYMRLRRKFV